jgi:phosphoglycolate phosphatase-like HAD superfamily hydrolase
VVTLLEVPPPGRRSAVLFDFDGTLSLIRRGWQQVMIDYIVDRLAQATGSQPDSFREEVRVWVAHLTGKQTVYQMLRLAEELRRRGIEPEDPLVYKREYHERLWQVIHRRIDDLAAGRARPDDWLLPGSRALLEALHERGLSLYLASGTDLEFVQREAQLLKIDHFFGAQIYGAIDDYRRFSKQIVIRRILEENRLSGPELVSFGDGYVEIEETRRFGGVAVGIASNEYTGHGLDPFKRERLVAAGAHLLAPNFLAPDDLLAATGIETAYRPPGAVFPVSAPDPAAGRYPRFDRSRLRLEPLSRREHLLDQSAILPLEDGPQPPSDPRLAELAQAMVAARRTGSAVILMAGAHLLRAGVVRYMIRLMEQDLITLVALNGAGPIHDFEMALIGATTESVGRYIREGRFGLWVETGRINEIVARSPGLGFGEALGREITLGTYPHRELSLLAAGWRLGMPVTVHIGIGYDIIHEHPNCDAAALGRASYEDFLVFAREVSRLEGGVLLNFGSAVMGPEVFLKALAMARNVAHQEGREIRRFTTAVFDLQDLGEAGGSEPPRDDPRYYFRPLKTLLVRTVRDGGRSCYFRGHHRETFPALFHAVQAARVSP